MEGGFHQEEFLKENASSLGSIAGMLDLSMMLETQALDLYLRFAAKIKETETKNILYRLADEEKSHLKALGNLREEREMTDD
jgi:rubrerythrin